MHQRRRGLEIKYLPPPSPHIEGSCGQYPRHELEAARRALIMQLHRASPAIARIKPKLGILPDNRRFVYVSQNNRLVGDLGNDPWTSASGCVYNGPQTRNAPPGSAPGAKSEGTAEEKRSHKATGSDSEQPQAMKIKGEGKNESTRSMKPEVISNGPQKTSSSSAPSRDALDTKSGAIVGGKRDCQATESDSGQLQTKKMKGEGMRDSTKTTKLGEFFKCDLCGLAHSSSVEMFQHLKASGHRTASLFQGEIEPQFRALLLQKPMALMGPCKDFGSRVPLCKMCGVKFDNIFSCLGHMAVSHRKQSLSYHVRQVGSTTTEVITMDGARPVCKVCQMRTNSLSELSSHCLSKNHYLKDLLQSGPDVYFACKMESCQKVFGYGSQMMTHLPQHRADVPEYSFVWAQLGDTSELSLLDADLDSESRVNLESILCSHLGLFYEKSSCTSKDRSHKRKNLEKYQQLLEEKKRDIADQKEKQNEEEKRDIVDQEEKQNQPRNTPLLSVCSF